MEKIEEGLEEIQKKMKAEIWTWSFCPFCKDAKKILIKNNIEFEEHIMDDKPDELQKIKDKYKHQTVPIILLDGKFIGGCDNLRELLSRN